MNLSQLIFDLEHRCLLNSFEMPLDQYLKLLIILSLFGDIQAKERIKTTHTISEKRHK